MDTSSTRIPPLPSKPGTEKIKRTLLRKGVFPTPKIVHTLRKKEIQKSIRKSKTIDEKNPETPLSEAEKQVMEEEYQFQSIKREYRDITKHLKAKTREKDGVLMVGKPWERVERVGLRELASGSKEYGGEKLKVEPLKELGEILAERNREWLLDDDIEEGDWVESVGDKKPHKKREVSDDDAIQFLIKRLSASTLCMQDWKFSRMMNQSGLRFTERCLLRIVGGLGAVGSWSHALSVVEWVYNRKGNQNLKSRFVYTKLLAVLGKARRPMEALDIFKKMREDCHIYPDMPAYRSISVTLGQSGLVKELMNVIECMRQKPSKRFTKMRSKNWDPRLEPDVVVFNAVLNACVPSHQWKGVSWVMEQMRKNGMKPNGATYGLAMEVMLQSGKYDIVHEFFGKMTRSGTAPNALTYKVLVRAFWEEGKVDEAVKAVRYMEQRGVVGTASVYYELACCLCKNGRWQDAMVEVEKLKKLPLTKPLEVTFTGMIMCCMEGGHVDDCISIFELMKDHCSLNIGTINAMLKAYGRNDMFARAKELFENIKRKDFSSNTEVGDGGYSLTPDAYTYNLILEASARAHQWEYFEFLYKEMCLNGCRLDQNKYAWLLVEASKVGKEHLLEHAFDTTLEAGEIPHLTFFTEMVCQATAQHQYERAVSLVKTMAHASFQVSESQWTDIFIGMHERIHEDGFEKLLDTLCSSELMQEHVVSNFSKSLQTICQSSSTDSRDLVALADIDVIEAPTSGEVGSKFGSEKSKEKRNQSVDALDEISTPEGSFSGSDNGLVESDVFLDYQENSNTMDYDDVGLTSILDGASEVSSSYVEGEKSSRYCEEGCVEQKSSSSILDGASEYNIKATLDCLTNQVDASSRFQLPSASEILEEWRKSRNKEGE